MLEARDFCECLNCVASENRSNFIKTGLTALATIGAAWGVILGLAYSFPNLNNNDFFNNWNFLTGFFLGNIASAVTGFCCAGNYELQINNCFFIREIRPVDEGNLCNYFFATFISVVATFGERLLSWKGLDRSSYESQKIALSIAAFIVCLPDLVSSGRDMVQRFARFVAGYWPRGITVRQDQNVQAEEHEALMGNQAQVPLGQP